MSIAGNYWFCAAKAAGGECGTVRSPETYTTRLLPGFDLDLAAIFEAADQVSE